MNSVATLRALAAAVLLPAAASAAVLTINPTADGYIRASQNASQTNNATNHIFLVGHTSASDDLRGVLSFDLNNPALVGATINSVTLTLYVESADSNSLTGAMADTLQLFSLTQSFSESTVTWSSRDGTTSWTTPGGSLGSLLATTSVETDTAAANDALVLTSGALASSVSSTIGGNLDLLVSLASPDASRDILRLASRTPLAGGNAAIIPALSIDYTAAAIPEPSTFAALAGLGMLGFAASKRRGRR